MVAHTRNQFNKSQNYSWLDLLNVIYKYTLLGFASMPQKQWLQVEVVNEIVMHFLLSFISSLDLKPLFVSIEENSGSVYFVLILFHFRATGPCESIFTCHTYITRVAKLSSILTIANTLIALTFASARAHNLKNTNKIGIM